MSAGIQKFVRITRAPFFTAAMAPVLLGGVIAWQEGYLHVGSFLLTLVGAVAIHGGLNIGNDYFDHLSGNDEINRELTPFSGGSRVIQEGILTARQVLIWSLSFFAVGIAVGIYLVAARGLPVLWLGLAGVFLAFFSSAPPIQLNYVGHGLGELAVGIGFGPLIVLGAYYVQAQRLTFEALWASLPVGLLIAAVLYINEFPDYEADKAAGKRTLVVLQGRGRAVWGYIVLVVLSYVVVVVGVALRILPIPLLLSFLSAPIAYRAIGGVTRFHSDTPKLIPSQAATIQLHLMTSLLLSLGYLVTGLV